MRYITTTEIICDGEKCTYKPFYIGKDIWGGKVVGDNILQLGQVPNYLGIAYRRWDIRASVMYPKPLHLIARFLNWLDYWTVIDMR